MPSPSGRGGCGGGGAGLGLLFDNGRIVDNMTCCMGTDEEGDLWIGCRWNQKLLTFQILCCCFYAREGSGPLRRTGGGKR